MSGAIEITASGAIQTEILPNRGYSFEELDVLADIVSFLRDHQRRRLTREPAQRVNGAPAIKRED